MLGEGGRVNGRGRPATRAEIVASTLRPAASEAVDACLYELDAGEPGMTIELNADYLARALASLEDVAEIELRLSGPSRRTLAVEILEQLSPVAQCLRTSFTTCRIALSKAAASIPKSAT